jgi:cardiolipin synthase
MAHEGPVVSQMQAVFVGNWIKATGCVLHGSEYFPTTRSTAGEMDAQMFGSSPVGGSESMHLMVAG